MKFQTVSRKPHFRLNMIRCRRCSPLCSIETTGYRLSYISIVSRLILPTGTRLGACDCFERFRVLSTFIVQCTRLATPRSNYVHGSYQRLSLCSLRPFMENIRFKRKCFNILYNFGTLVKSRKCDLYFFIVFISTTHSLILSIKFGILLLLLLFPPRSQ